jgi:hypothetical protein
LYVINSRRVRQGQRNASGIKLGALTFMGREYRLLLYS